MRGNEADDLGNWEGAMYGTNRKARSNREADRCPVTL